MSREGSDEIEAEIAPIDETGTSCNKEISFLCETLSLANCMGDILRITEIQYPGAISVDFKRHHRLPVK